MDDAKDPQQPADRYQAGNDHLAQVNRDMAKGAAWMVAMRFAIRALGVVSMVILARLLVPADFGLFAMASITYGLIQIMGAFGFNLVLIQKQKAGRDYYDTVWTLRILKGVATCCLLFAIAVPMADFFGDPRLVEIVYVLALVALVRGVSNIGIVDFRKYLNFHKDFMFEVAVKLAMFCVTITAAFLLRSYWALVIGIASGGLVRVALSYAMHPYRPRLSLARWREIMHFSKWLLVNNILVFANRQSASLIVGRILGATSLGLYTLAYEIASLAASVLVAPIRRALLPGYAKLAHDFEALRKSYIDGLALILMLCAPAAVGIGLVADPMVRLFLGDKWLDAIPLLQVLALFGLIQVSIANVGSVFLALGRPYLNTIITGTNVAVGIPLFIWATLQWGVVGTVWSLVISNFVSAAVTYVLSIKVLGLSAQRLISAVWRTPMSIIAMIAVLGSLDVMWATNATIAGLAFQLIFEVLTGVGVYVGLHLGLWYMAGSPRTAESLVLTFLSGKLQQMRKLPVHRT